jgi:hypothetical protein
MKKFFCIIFTILLVILVVNVRGPSQARNSSVDKATLVLTSDDSSVESPVMMSSTDDAVMVKKKEIINNNTITSINTTKESNYSTNSLVKYTNVTQRSSSMICKNSRSTSKEAKEGCSILKLPLNSNNSVVINPSLKAV